MSLFTGDHIHSSYDRELERLGLLLSQMAAHCELQVERAITALADGDRDLAARTVGDDMSLDAMEREVEGLVIRLLALRAPVALDLRNILGSLKMASFYERAGDSAKHVARGVLTLADLPSVPLTDIIVDLGKAAQAALHEVNNAAAQHDVATAEKVWSGDEKLDDLYLVVVNRISAHAGAHPHTIDACTQLHFIAKAFERIGDQATNLAEIVRFQAIGTLPPLERPKKA